ncbi:putative phosphatase phospho1 [Larimichthys crocea]|uniref:Uncharacterized protein n=1 Tax=Larimichthys crocea TaxID=215358 RepID=A0ACD3R6N7_LARCR|nr:putative phosphatase phospho1 [Larimichthys crocea]
MASQSTHIPSDKRFIIFFDFDETIVDETSDDMVVQAAPGHHLPGWLKDTYHPGRYNEYMQRVLAYLAEQGVTESDMRTIMEKLPTTPGMLTLFQFLRARPPQDFEVVIGVRRQHLLHRVLAPAHRGPPALPPDLHQPGHLQQGRPSGDAALPFPRLPTVSRQHVQASGHQGLCGPQDAGKGPSVPEDLLRGGRSQRLLPSTRSRTAGRGFPTARFPHAPADHGDP